jgi:hypothetical protein
MTAIIYVYFVLSAICQDCLYHQPKIDTRSVAREESRAGGLFSTFPRDLWMVECDWYAELTTLVHFYFFPELL